MKTANAEAYGKLVATSYPRLLRIMPPKWTQSCDRIVKIVAAEYEITPEKLLSRDRSERIAGARMVAMHLARELTQASWSDLGEYFERDHGSIANGWKVIRDYSSVYPDMLELLAKLRSKLEVR